MKISRLLPALAAVTVLAASCTSKAVVSGEITGAGESDIIVKALNLNAFTSVDTLKAKDGKIKYSMEVAKGQPEFIYLFKGQKRIAGFVLCKGDKITFKADTLGGLTIKGSKESELLHQADSSFNTFLTAMVNAKDIQEANKTYVDFYRQSVKFIVCNPFSISTVPVLFSNVSGAPVFSRPEDAVFFKAAADSLTKVYPESKYVKALAGEAERREKSLNMISRIKAADQLSYPDLVMTDINGQPVSLRGVKAKVKMLYFWTSQNDAQKMFSIEKMVPIYNQYKGKGLEIYAVCVDSNKSHWAEVVKAQNLEWINVNDGYGLASPALSTYNVNVLPRVYLIENEEIVTREITGDAALKAELDKVLN